MPIVTTSAMLSKMTDRERSELIKAAQAKDGAIMNRLDTRFMLPMNCGLAVEIVHGDGTSSTVKVCPLDISSRGIGFFHTAYIHPGKPCICELTGVTGQRFKVHGRAVRASHVMGRIHIVGLQLEEEVDVGMFISIAPQDQAQGATSSEHNSHCQLVATVAEQLAAIARNGAAASQLTHKASELLDVCKKVA
jgi:hypothetical protein